jgi:hypothetical protein
MEVIVSKGVEGEPRERKVTVKDVLFSDVGDVGCVVLSKVKEVLGLVDKLYLLDQKEYDVLKDMLQIYSSLALFDLFHSNYRLKLLLIGRFHKLWKNEGRYIFAKRKYYCIGKMPTHSELEDFLKKSSVSKS